MRFGVVTAFEQEDACSRELLAACRALGDAEAVDPTTMAVHVGSRGVEVSIAGRPANRFDVFLLVRLSERGDPDVQYEVLRALELSAAPVLSRIDSLLAAQDKLRTSSLLARSGIRTPPAVVIQRPDDVAAALDELGCTVLKPIYGSLGVGVELVQPDGAGIARARERVAAERALYLQRFVEHHGEDVRAFVVGDRVEAATLRRAPAGDFRTNLAAGGQPHPVHLTAEIAEAACAAARALGLDWAGVDIVIDASGPSVIEVNGSPSWDRTLQVTGNDMAERIATHAARKVEALREAGRIGDRVSRGTRTGRARAREET